MSNSESKKYEPIEAHVSNLIPERVHDQVDDDEGELILLALPKGVFSQWAGGIALTNHAFIKWSKKKVEKYPYKDMSEFRFNVEFDEYTSFKSTRVFFTHEKKKVNQFFSGEVDFPFVATLLALLNDAVDSPEIKSQYEQFEANRAKRRELNKQKRKIDAFMKEAQQSKGLFLAAETLTPEIGLKNKLWKSVDNSVSPELDGKTVLLAECQSIQCYGSHMQLWLAQSNAAGRFVKNIPMGGGIAGELLASDPSRKNVVYFWGWDEIESVEYRDVSKGTLFKTIYTKFKIQTDGLMYMCEMGEDDGIKFIQVLEDKGVDVQKSSEFVSEGAQAKGAGRPTTGRHPCPDCGYRNSQSRVTCKMCGVNLDEAFSRE